MKDRFADLDAEIKEKLKNWKQLLADYQVPSIRKAIWQIINTFVPYIGLWILTYFSMDWSIWIWLPLIFINAFFLVRIFIIQHDCGHQSFTKSKKWNGIIGRFCSVFSSLPYKYWAKVHNFHHGHSGQLETREVGDVPFITVEEYNQKNWWGRLGYRIWRIPFVLFLIAPVYYFIVSNRFPIFVFKGWKNINYSQLRNNLALIVIYGGLAWLIGWQKFLLIQLSLVFMFLVIAFWFFYVQHQHEFAYKKWKDNWDFVVSSVRGSTYYKLPKVFQWLTGNIGFHHIHHLNSVIPNYNLEKAFKENKILNKYVTVVGFWESLKMMNHKLWDESQQRMISFREYSRMKKSALVQA